jgi:uncharacterized protein (TIGR00730 family)
MRITVYCGSSQRSAEPFLSAARAVGGEIARRGHVLIYGGAKIGLMGAVADAALAEGGAVRGVILRDFIDRGDVHHPGVEMESVDDMRSRKAGLDGHADAFVTLPGGLGTLEELSEMLSFRQLGFHRRPIVLLNTDGFFDSLLAWIERAIESGFIRPEHRQLMAITDDPARAIELCEEGAGSDTPSKFQPRT